MRSPLSLLFVAAVPYHAGVEAASVGNYIRAGLGITSTSAQAAASASQSRSSTYSNSTSVSSTKISNGTDLAGLQCAASWASYSSSTATDVTLVTSTYTTYTVFTETLVYGTGNVFKTTDGIPVAHGTFTPTSTTKTVVNSTQISPYSVTTARNPTVTPSCKDPSPSECSRLYVSYLESLGLSSNASIPSITPAPSNSPQCPDYYYSPYTTCYYSSPQGQVSGCTVSGNNVRLFYWPTAKANATGPSATATYANTSAPTVVQSFAPGITFTSPSIYVSFDYLSATSLYVASDQICSSCGWDGCAATDDGGAAAFSKVGTSIAGTILTFAPEHVSTLLASFAQPASAANVFAHGLPGYFSSMLDVQNPQLFTPKLLTLDAITNPAPTDYYLRPNGAPGCTEDYPTPECSTMFEGLYHPILSLPSEVSLLQGPWATCVPAIFGVYDPPTALTAASTINAPSHGPQSTTSSSDQSSSSSYTALPETKPTLSSASATSSAAPPPPSSTSVQSAPPSAPGYSSSAPQPASYSAVSASQGQQTTEPAAAPPSSSSTAEVVLPATTTNALSVLESAASAASQASNSPSLASASGVSSAPPAAAVTTTIGSEVLTISHASDSAVLVNGISASQVEVVTQTNGQTATVVQVAGSSVTVPSGDPAKSSDPSAAVVAPLTTTNENQILTISRASNSAIVVNGATASEIQVVAASNGASATVVAYGSNTITLAATDLAQPTNANGADPAAITTSVGGHAVTISQEGSSAIFVNGITASQAGVVTQNDGQMATLLAYGSSTLTLLPSELAQPSSEISNAVLAATIVAPSSTLRIVQDPSHTNLEVVGGSITLTAGGAAQTIAGVTLSAVSGGVVEDGTTVPLLQPSGTVSGAVLEAVITATSATLSVVQDPSQSDLEVVDGSITLTAGGAAQTLAGVTLSAVSGGVVEDGTTLPLTAIAATASRSSPVSLTSNGPEVSASSTGKSATTTSSGAKTELNLLSLVPLVLLGWLVSTT